MLSRVASEEEGCVILCSFSRHVGAAGNDATEGGYTCQLLLLKVSPHNKK